MNNLKTFEEYKFVKVDRKDDNERDIKEPFFNKNKPLYLRNKRIIKKGEARKEEARLKKLQDNK